MHTKKPSPLLLFVTILMLVSLACSTSAAEPTASQTSTPEATATITPTPTNTPRPSATPRPTRTPNLAATQRVEDLNAEAKSYFDLGYLPTADGKFTEFDDFSEEWAQLGWYQWWILDEVASNFYLSGHLKWASAYRNADISGCGFIFAIQENNDHYAVFLDRAKILVLDSNQSSNSSRTVGTTRGTGIVKFDNPFDSPAEADFTLIVKDAYAYVLMDGEVVGEYTLSQSRLLKGNLGLSILSGTNKDFGTRCEMTNLHVWVPNK